MKSIFGTFLFFSLTVLRGEQVHEWANFKPGSSARLKFTITGPDNTMEFVRTSTLVQIDSKFAVVEQTMSAGKQRSIIPLDRLLSIPDSATKEVLTVAGKAVECSCFDKEFPLPDGALKSRHCYSKSVPGLIVRSVTRQSGKDPSETTMELLDFVIP